MPVGAESRRQIPRRRRRGKDPIAHVVAEREREMEGKSQKKNTGADPTPQNNIEIIVPRCLDIEIIVK